MRLRRSLPLDYLMSHGMFGSIVKDRVRRAMALAMAAVMEQALANAMEKWKVCVVLSPSCAGGISWAVADACEEPTRTGGHEADA